MKEINVFGKSFDMSDYGLVQFDDKKPVLMVTVPQTITANEIDSIVCTAIEGGINYWSGVDNTGENWSKDIRPKDVCMSEWITILLLSGKSVQFYDIEDEKVTWELTLEKLKKGIELNAEKRPHDCDLENLDATTADCIFQFSLLGEIIYD